ncbi:MAG TPA: MAPEG family protein [Myxococcota bacterium]|nr:MAPEG family protein [Myxococcota bacterium]
MTLPVPITAVFAGVLGIMFLVLELPIGLLRTRTNVSLGDGGNPDLTVAIRRHANFVEHVPLALLLMALLELNGASHMLLAILGTALVLARLMHPFGLDVHVMRRPPRGFGAATTSLVILVASAVLIWQAI